jgi:hypothetical protein
VELIAGTTARGLELWSRLLGAEERLRAGRRPVLQPLAIAAVRERANLVAGQADQVAQLTSRSSLNQASASAWLPSDHAAISRRVARDPGGSSSTATTRVMTGSFTALP